MRWLRNLLIILSTVCPIHTASGQTVKGEISTGFGGYYRIGKCMPVKVRLENSGSDLTGKIEIQISQSSFAQTVSLPSPSRKTFALYVVPPKYFHDLEVRLFTEGKLLKTFGSEVKRVLDDERLIIRSSTLKQALLSVAGSSIQSYKEKAVFLDPEDFPESWNEYDAVNLVLLDVSDTIRLSELQRTALSRWTLLGGKVTLLNRDRIMAEFQQKKESISPRTALGLGSFGGGMESSEQNPTLGYLPSLLELDEEIFKALRIRNPMPLAGIVWPLGIFLLLYGCAVVFCLTIPAGIGMRKLWSFAGIPAVAILFSILSSWIGNAVHAGSMPVRQYSVAHVFANSVETFTTSDLSLLFSRKATSSLRPLIPSSYLVQNESENARDILYYDFQSKGAPSATFHMDLWRTVPLSFASFSNRGQFMVLRNAESTVLANRSSYGLFHCTLIRSGGFAPIGDIPAGRELQLKLESAASSSNTPSSRSYGSGMLSRTVDVYQTETLAGIAGDCVVCEMNGLIPGFESDSTGLSYTGSTAVIYHLGKYPVEESNMDRK